MAWLDKKANKVILALSIVSFVLAGITLALAVPRCGPLHHETGGLLEVCWDETGRARYVDGIEVEEHGPCEGSEELRFPSAQIPLTTAIVATDGSPVKTGSQGQRIVSQAAADANSQLGFKLYAPGVIHTSKAAIIIHWGASYDIRDDGADTVPGYCIHRIRRPDLLRAEIFVRAVHDDALAYRITLHELLHAAGLRDTDVPGSAMFSLTRETLMGNAQPVRIIDASRTALRDAYMQ